MGGCKGKLLYVIGSLELGGAEKHLTHIAIGLKKRGWAPGFFVLDTNSPLALLLKDNHIPIHTKILPRWVEKIPNKRLRNGIRFVLATPVLLTCLWRLKPQIVHFFLPVGYILGGITSLFAPVKIRIMSRRSLNCYQASQKLCAALEKRLHKTMTAICANSLRVKENLEAEGVPASQIRLLYNGINTQPFQGPFDRQGARQQVGLTQETVVFVIVANLFPYKGHEDLLRALALIRQSLPSPWALLCVGRDRGAGRHLQHLCKELDLSQNVTFLGEQSDGAFFLRMADIGVLCSHQEGFSNAVLEGMAASLPMVVTDVGGNGEAVINGETGLVVPPHTPSALSQALLDLALNPAKRLEMGRKGAERVDRLFRLETCLDAYEALYTGFLEKRNPSPLSSETALSPESLA